MCKNGEQKDCTIVIEKLRGHRLTMSKHKFALNVVEKAHITSDAAGHGLLIDKICWPQLVATRKVLSVYTKDLNLSTSDLHTSSSLSDSQIADCCLNKI